MMRAFTAILTISSFFLSADAFSSTATFGLTRVQQQTTTSLEAKKTAKQLAQMKVAQQVDDAGVAKATAYLGASVAALGLLFAPSLIDMTPGPASTPAPKVAKVKVAKARSAKKQVSKTQPDSAVSAKKVVKTKLKSTGGGYNLDLD